MTQLFDTTTYDAETPEATYGPAPLRHLRSVSMDHTDQLDARRADWRLDENTIEIGRRGIAKAREALKESAKGRPNGRTGQRRAA